MAVEINVRRPRRPFVFTLRSKSATWSRKGRPANLNAWIEGMDRGHGSKAQVEGTEHPYGRDETRRDGTRRVATRWNEMRQIRTRPAAVAVPSLMCGAGMMIRSDDGPLGPSEPMPDRSVRMMGRSGGADLPPHDARPTAKVCTDGQSLRHHVAPWPLRHQPAARRRSEATTASPGPIASTIGRRRSNALPSGLRPRAWRLPPGLVATVDPAWWAGPAGRGLFGARMTRCHDGHA